MRIENKRLSHGFDIIKKLEAGIVLTGAEAKAVNDGKVDISKAFAKITKNELFLHNAAISTSKSSEEDQRRIRKLLVHKREIISLLITIKARRLTMIPLSVYTRGRLVKVELGLVKSRRKRDKKEALKRRDIAREVEREMKNHR